MYKEVEKIEIYLEKNGIITKNAHIPINNVDGMCFSFSQDLDYNINDIIVYDSNKLDNDCKKIINVLIHEEAHLNNPDTMFKLDDPIYKIKTKERKIKRIISRKYIPQDKLFNLIYNKKLTLFEISDELCLPEQLIQDAYDYYSQLESWINKKNKLLINEL